MKLGKFKEAINRFHAEYGDDLLVTDGAGLSVNFADVISLPVQGSPKPTEEQLADPYYTRPHNDVLSICVITKTEERAFDANQPVSFKYWLIELQKIFKLVDGGGADESEKNNYLDNYNAGLSPADTVKKYSMGALNRKSEEDNDESIREAPEDTSSPSWEFTTVLSSKKSESTSNR